MKKALANPSFYVWAVLWLVPAQVYFKMYISTLETAFWSSMILKAHDPKVTPMVELLPTIQFYSKVWIASMGLNIILLFIAHILLRRKNRKPLDLASKIALA